MCVPIRHLASYLDYHGFAADRPVDRSDVFRIGAGWADLGLTVPVTGSTLEAIGSHVHPENGRTLGSGTAEISGYSILFTCDKSVSIAACFDPRVRQAFLDAVKVTVAAAEALSGMARDRRGANHDTNAVRPTGRVLAVGHAEHQNRNQEPHEHADVLWINATCVDRKKDTWRALQADLLMRSQVDLWDFANLELACLLRGLGYAVTYVDGVTSLPCVRRSLCEKTSSRADEIAGWYKSSGYSVDTVTSGRVEGARRSEVRKASARAKSEELSPEDMRARLTQADPVAVREILQAVAEAERDSVNLNPPVHPTHEVLDAVVDRLPLGTAHYLDVRLACAMASTQPGVLSPAAALERMRKRFRQPESPPWILAVSLPETKATLLPVIQGLPALCEKSQSTPVTGEPSAKAALGRAATATEKSIAASRSSFLAVVGTVAQLDRFARVVLETKLPGRRSTRPVVVLAGPRISIVDARRALIDEALRVSAAEIDHGRRVVLLLDRRDPAHTRTLNRLPNAPFILRGKAQKKAPKSKTVEFTAFVDATADGPPRRGRAVFKFLRGQGRSLKVVEPPKEAIRHYADVDPSTRKLLNFRRYRRERKALLPGTRIAFLGREKDARVEIGTVDQIRDRRSVRLRDKRIIDLTKVELFVLRTPTRRGASPDISLPEGRKPSGPTKRSRKSKPQVAPAGVAPVDPMPGRAPTRKPGSRKPRTPKLAPSAQPGLPADPTTPEVPAEALGKPSTVEDAQPKEMPVEPMGATVDPAEIARNQVKAPETDQKIPGPPARPAPEPETLRSVSGDGVGIGDPGEPKRVGSPASDDPSALDVEETPDKVTDEEADRAPEPRGEPARLSEVGVGARPPEPAPASPLPVSPSTDDADLEIIVPGSASKEKLLGSIDAANEPRDPSQGLPDI